MSRRTDTRVTVGGTYVFHHPAAHRGRRPSRYARGRLILARLRRRRDHLGAANGDPQIAAHHGQPVTVLQVVAPVATRALHPTRHMYRVQFPDGFEADVHPDEITAGGAS